MPSVNINPIESKPSYMSIQLDYNRANEIATVACYMGNRLTMAVTTLMAKKYYPNDKALTYRIDGQDVCQTLVSEIHG